MALSTPVMEDIIRGAVEQGTLDKHLHREKVHKGGCFFVPSGVVHGIGAGTLLAEIQERSNVTYRVYDYDRKDKNGQKRFLHVEKALEVMDRKPVRDVRQRQHLVHYQPGSAREVISRCEHFKVEHIRVTKGGFVVEEESFQILLCLNGEGQIENASGATKPLVFQNGECMFLPACLGDCTITGKADMLKIRC